MSDLSEIGEFGLIDRLTSVLPGHSDVVEGIGDDCAVVRIGDRLLLLSCDASLENIHFNREFMTPHNIGYRAAASALSDIAAMGGQPLFMLVTLACPEDTDCEFLEELYQGLNTAATNSGSAIIGGDTTRFKTGIVLDVMVIGEAVEGRYCTRAGAKPGDAVLVTGWPGSAALGLLELQDGRKETVSTQKFLSPTPRIQEGLWLSERSEVHALIDLSDGLIQDAGHIAERSGLGLDLKREALPINDTFSKTAKRLGASPETLVLTGGEEYELILAVAVEQAEALMQEFTERFKLPIHCVGQFTEAWTDLRVDGNVYYLKGFEHF